MTTKVSVPLISNTTSGYGTFGTALLTNGTDSVLQNSIKSNSVIFLTPQTKTTPTGQVFISSITAFSDFGINSTVTAGNGNSISYFRLQPASDDYSGSNPISLPYFMSSGPLQNIGQLTITSGASATINLPGQAGNSVVIVGRVYVSPNISWGDLTADLDGSGLLTVSTTNSNENSKINFLVLPYPTSTATNQTATIPILDSTSSSATYGQINLASGFTTINTTACKTSSFIFVFPTFNVSSSAEYIAVFNQSNGSFGILSTVASTTLCNWLVINA